jgi:undecaprenyl diphosphate synthase
MDGNGRWGQRRGLTRSDGHRAGAEAVRRTVEAAPRLGVTTLSLFAFSSANWRRPTDEVEALMRLLSGYLERDGPRFVESGARLVVIGRRDRLPEDLAGRIAEAEAASAGGGRFTVRIAIDYSAREAISRAASALGPSATLDDLDRLIAGEADAGPVDLLIRTGGEQRLSDFLLWESAFAELWFTKRMWPEFGAEDLQAAITDFHRRERTFGAAPKLAERAPA